MQDLTILREKNPAMAESIEAWRRKYQRNYDFNDSADQATFYEGMLEFGRHVATNAYGANVSLSVSTQGVSGLSVSVMPKSLVDAS
jgi:hypothetical protein